MKHYLRIQYEANKVVIYYEIYIYIYIYIYIHLFYRNKHTKNILSTMSKTNSFSKLTYDIINIKQL